MQNIAQDRQVERLKYIDLCAYILGAINRVGLMKRFNIMQAWATKDFTAYQENAPHNLVYDNRVRAYVPTDWFSPYYEHDIDDALDLLCKGTQSIVCEPKFANQNYSYTIQNVRPKLENIAALLRAINRGYKVEVSYVSRSRGLSTRVIAPHSLIRTGCFTYVRAFDHLSGEFRSFKLNRIQSSRLRNEVPIEAQIKAHDVDWTTDTKLVIEINGDLPHPESIEFDYGLKNGQLTLVIKKALIRYLLTDWNIAPMEYGDLPSTLFPLRVTSQMDQQ